jgi:hypothetical protein
MFTERLVTSRGDLPQELALGLMFIAQLSMTVQPGRADQTAEPKTRVIDEGL